MSKNERVTITAKADNKVHRYELRISDEHGNQTRLEVKKDTALVELAPGTYVLIGFALGASGGKLELGIKADSRVLVEKATVTIPEEESGGAGAVTFRLEA